MSSNVIPTPSSRLWLAGCLLAMACLSCSPEGGGDAPDAKAAGAAAPSGLDTGSESEPTVASGNTKPASAGSPQVAVSEDAPAESTPAESTPAESVSAESTSAGSTPAEDGPPGPSTGSAPKELPPLAELEAAMLVVPIELTVVADSTLRLDTDPPDFPMPATVGGVPVRILRDYHPTSGVLMRIKSVREDSVDSGGGVVFHGPEWAYFDTAALSSIKWWNNNVSHGPIQHWRRVGTRKSEGRFVDGERDGLQQTFSKNGAMITRGAYISGRRMGLHEQWFASGQRMSVESFHNDRLHGSRRVWDRNGLLMQFENYVDGKRHGRWSDYHPTDGDPREWGEFDSGVRTGVWERGSKEGVVLERSLFVNDRRDGVAKKWNEAGQLIEEVTYVLGVRTGPRRTWYDDGTLQSEGALEEGLRTGYWRYQKADGGLNELWSGEYSEDQRVGPGTPPK